MSGGWKAVRDAMETKVETEEVFELVREAIASDRRMSKWGQPGYPLDVQVMFPPGGALRGIPGYKGEIVWVTVVAAYSTVDQWIGRLLNTPHHPSLKKDEYIVFCVEDSGLHFLGKAAAR